ncbi:Histidinol dehydrogenase [Maridesulfovibrio ferrireducens]|uniref:Histidinol dehydrogenase n=1 Tax=Maridesulfovibrio ferrireducens TaxID=246191 RepID=A0A1G9LMM0_9BACT|nr:histidinol dehydrogenase [Maridesulfovibrio ferrireducens]SDL62745.1 Histidinol dehydrogenase [Maridesulfovibrio ferrireducens]
MTEDNFAFPEWLDDFQITDEVFAVAYEAVLPPQRAWMKKTIAQVYAVNSPDSPQSKWTVNTWKGGFETEIANSPLDCVLMLVDKGATSAVRILAALAPALAVGVQNILVVFVGEGELSQPVLTGFELAGQEAVVSLSDDKFSELISFVYESEVSTAILDLRSCPTDLSYSENVRYWRAPNISVISICADEDGPDMDVVKFAHPDVTIEETTIEDLAESGGDVAIVPAELIGEALVDFKMVLSHEQEGCWMWNNLTDRFFRKDSVALAVCL